MDQRKWWQQQSSALVKMAMVHRHITYDELSARLAAVGFRQTPGTLKSKVSRGTFGAALFLAIHVALGRQMVPLDLLREDLLNAAWHDVE